MAFAQSSGSSSWIQRPHQLGISGRQLVGGNPPERVPENQHRPATRLSRWCSRSGFRDDWVVGASLSLICRLPAVIGLATGLFQLQPEVDPHEEQR